MTDVNATSMPDQVEDEQAKTAAAGGDNGEQHEVSTSNTSARRSGERGVDMSKYKKVLENKDAAAEDEVRITNKSKIESYVSYALSLFEEKNFEKVTLKAMGRSIYKAVTTAEVCKRRLSGLHQVTDIVSEKVVDRFEPIDPESGLETIEKERFIPCMTIVLATNEEAVDVSSKGYQPPLPDAEVVPRDQHVYIDTRVVDNLRGNANGGGRGGGSNNRNWRKGGSGRSRGGGNRNRDGGGRGHMGQNPQAANQMQMPQQGMNMMAPYQMMMPNMGNMAAPNGQWMMMPPMQAQPYDAATLEAMQNAGIVPSLSVQQQAQYQQQYDQHGQQNKQNSGRRQQGRNNRGGRRNEGEQRGGNQNRRGGRRGGGGNREGDKGRRGNNNKQGGNKPNQRKQRAPSASAFPPMTVIQSSNPSAAAAKYQQQEAHTQATTNQNGGMAVGATSSVEGVAITSAMGMAPPEAAMGERGPWQQVLLRGSAATSSSEGTNAQQSSNPAAPTSGVAQHDQGGHHQAHAPSHVPADSGTAPQNAFDQTANMAPQKPVYNAPLDQMHTNHVQQSSTSAPEGFNKGTGGHPEDGHANSAGNSTGSGGSGGKTTWARILGGR